MNLVRSLHSLVLVGCLAIPSIATVALPVQPAFAQQEQMARTLTVTGQGTASVATSLTQVQLGVEVQAKTAEAAQQQVAQQAASVVEFLRSRQVEKLQTTGINLSPQYDYSNNQQRIIGYIASNNVSFRIPTDQAGDILDRAVQSGASRIDSVSFVANDSAIETARQQAIQAAIKSAQSQAGAVLSSLSLTQKEIVSIQVNGAAPPPPIFYRREAQNLSADAAAPSPVIGGEQDVEASVTLQIRY